MPPDDDSSGSGPLLDVAAQAVQFAHHLRNLLMIIGRSVDSIRDRMPAKSAIDDDLAELDRSIDRAFHVTDQLIGIAHPDFRERVVVDVNQAVLNAKSMIERAVGGGATPHFQIAATRPHVLVTPYELEWVLLSVVIHCREAMPHGGCLSIGTANRTLRAGDGGTTVRLTVAETEADALPETRDRTFPSHWNASDIPASRLRNIAVLVESIGGWLNVDYQAGRATTVHVDLPVHGAGG
jgi:hypothetical protein